MTVAVCTAAKHGTETEYKLHKCRCPAARRAYKAYKYRWQTRRARGERLLVSSVGTVRRLEALQTLGWPQHEVIRRALGYSKHPQWRPMIQKTTADKIKAVYEELSNTQGPSQQVRTLALKRGYAPPLAWNNIDNPNDFPRFGSKAAMVKELLDAGMSPAQLGRELGLDHRSFTNFTDDTDLSTEAYDRLCELHSHLKAWAA